MEDILPSWWFFFWTCWIRLNNNFFSRKDSRWNVRIFDLSNIIKTFCNIVPVIVCFLLWWHIYFLVLSFAKERKVSRKAAKASSIIHFSYLKKVTAPKLPLCLAIAKVFSQKMHYSPSPGFFFNYSTNVLRLANYFQKGSGKNRIFYCLFKWCVRTWKLH